LIITSLQVYSQVFFDCVTKNKIQHPIITVAITPNIACVFHPLCTNAAFRLYFFTVTTYSENPLARQARLMHQNTTPRGRAIRRSSCVGVEERWKDIRIAEETMAR
jgi:hypothetical protein